MDYHTEFPSVQSKYLKAEDFQDREVLLTFKGWKKKANEDDPSTKKNGKSWKEKLKYQLRYSYPEWAIDEAMEQRLDANGQPFKNQNYDPNYPHGYSITYLFEEGELECGSLPLFKQFCYAKPSVGEKLVITRQGKDKETVWFVKRVTHKEELPVIQVDDKDEFGADNNMPF